MWVIKVNTTLEVIVPCQIIKKKSLTMSFMYVALKNMYNV